MQREIEEEDDEDGDEDEDGDGDADGDGDGDGGIDGDEDEDEFSAWGRFRRREEEEDFDRDPEIAEILGHSVDNPEKFRSKVSYALWKLILRKKFHGFLFFHLKDLVFSVGFMF